MPAAADPCAHELMRAGDGVAAGPWPARDFMHGAVTQLGERLNGIQEVRDLISLGSTTLRLRLRVAGHAKAGAVGVSAEALAKAELRFGEGRLAKVGQKSIAIMPQIFGEMMAWVQPLANEYATRIAANLEKRLREKGYRL